MLSNINYNPDVLSCLANLSNDEVFTPPEIANKMLDTLPPELFRSKDTKFLDPFTKSGVFLREIAKRLIEGLAEEIPDLEKRVQHIMQHQIYGIGITELTALLARRTLYCAKKTSEVYSVAQFFEKEEGNIHFSRVEHTWQNGRCEYCGASQDLYDRDDMMETHAYHFIHNENPYKNMKFDVIIGNPPYQLSDSSASASANPLYHQFIQKAIKMQPHYLVMIVPSRWFSGGKGLDDFREQMLKDQRIKEIHDIPTSSEVFPGVEIKGGVNYFLWQSDYKGDCLIKTYEEGKVISEMKRPLMEPEADIFIRYNGAVSIFRKVKKYNEKSFSEVVSSRKPFGLATNFKGNNNPYKNTDNVTLYQTKGIGYIKRADVPQNRHWIDEHKIIVPYAVGSGNSKTDKVNPIYAAPNTACTETYLVIGPFKNKQKCENVISYIKTKFFHFMLTLKKNTQHTTQKAYEFVPQQDFSKSWTDKELYKKYDLTEEEINYIESMVRPME
ncbi:restriction endonuclease [Riemerella anatipestifer]|uniref:Eco57I restriction-modification methylase domain-containing protein n=1 Tax=Riemerella anatipestifer TaxID=34085 RepID=UPI0007EC4F96|nr:Eco57I restriction-modification methylase domain-containing protein [Riemerella anatipestifer]OBP42728.1 restriction endonuclease [Riemerella anatipestifer]